MTWSNMTEGSCREKNLFIFDHVFGEPEAFVGKVKQGNLIAAANAFLGESLLNDEVRFDIVSVIDNQGELKIHHIEDAFYPVL